MAKNSPVAVSAADKAWEAERDARTLAEAEAIEDDDKRYDAAIKAINRILEEEEKAADERRQMVLALKDLLRKKKKG